MVPSEAHLRHCLLYEFDLGHSVEQACANLKKAYANAAPSFEKCHKFFEQFGSPDKTEKSTSSASAALGLPLQWPPFEESPPNEGGKASSSRKLRKRPVPSMAEADETANAKERQAAPPPQVEGELVQLEVGLTQRGQQCLWFQGHRYNSQGYHTKSWRCNVRTCRAKVRVLSIEQNSRTATGVLLGGAHGDQCRDPVAYEEQMKWARFKELLVENPSLKPKMLAEQLTNMGNGNECEAQNATAVANFKARANRLRKKLLSGDFEEWTAQHLQSNEFHTMQQAQAAQPNDWNPIQQQQQNAFSPSQQVQQQFAQPKEHNEPEQQARAVRPAISHIAVQPNEFNAFGTSSSAILGQPEGVQ